MAEIMPFQMVQYGPEYSNALKSLITPPYDVISPEQQDSFYKSHPFNVIRLVLGKQFSSDTPEDNRYTRASNTLKKWMTDKVLVRKPKPGFTLYQMDFRESDGNWKRIDGFVGLLKAEDYGAGKVLPHEKTYSGPKKDQLKLLRACRANFTPIHAMFNDPEGIVLKLYESLLNTEPEQEVRDSEEIIHRTWSLCEENAVHGIVEFLREKSLFIADGHHRYETALAYRREMEARNPSTIGQPDNYIMSYFTSMSHPGLTVLPAHRMLRDLKDFNKEEFLRRMSDCFEIHDLDYDISDLENASKRLSSKLREFAKVGGHFGVLFNGEQRFRLISLRDPEIFSSFLSANIPESLINLDVTIFRELILGHCFGLDKEDLENHIEYTPSAADALKKTMLGEIQVSFILNPTRVDQMTKVAELGQKLPHKSTYFYPKISSGLVLNVF